MLTAAAGCSITARVLFRGHSYFDTPQTRPPACPLPVKLKRTRDPARTACDVRFCDC